MLISNKGPFTWHLLLPLIKLTFPPLTTWRFLVFVLTENWILISIFPPWAQRPVSNWMLCGESKIPRRDKKVAWLYIIQTRLIKFCLFPVVWIFSSKLSLPNFEGIERRALGFVLDDYISFYHVLFKKVGVPDIKIILLRYLAKSMARTCAGNAGNIFPTTDFKGNRELAIPACIPGGGGGGGGGGVLTIFWVTGRLGPFDPPFSTYVEFWPLLLGRM